MIMDLKQLAKAQVDMLNTAMIGNSGAKVMHVRIVTPRGYLL